jgi:hypothetical protein
LWSCLQSHRQANQWNCGHKRDPSWLTATAIWETSFIQDHIRTIKITRGSTLVVEYQILAGICYCHQGHIGAIKITLEHSFLTLYSVFSCTAIYNVIEKLTNFHGDVLPTVNSGWTKRRFPNELFYLTRSTLFIHILVFFAWPASSLASGAVVVLPPYFPLFSALL